MNVTPINCSGVMDNSANVHVVTDKRLFVGPILPCPTSVNVGTVVGSNPPSGIGLARTQWQDNHGAKHEADLVDALHFPDSPVNVVSVTKLGIDRRDPLLNIQTFPTYSILTWNNGQNMMKFHHNASNLPELPLLSTFNPLQCLTTQLKSSSIQLTKEEKIKLFEYMSTKDLNNVPNALVLSIEEKE